MWAEASTLMDSLPNGGAVAAIIVVVVLFLKKQEKSDEALKAMVDSFTAEMVSSRADYRDHLTSIMSQGLEAHKETRDAIRAITQASSEPPRGKPK